LPLFTMCYNLFTLYLTVPGGLQIVLLYHVTCKIPLCHSFSFNLYIKLIKFNMRKLSFTILLFHVMTTAIAQQYSKAVNEQITRVENNLSGGIVMDGYNLQERMKHYNVSGLSIAVIDNYQVVWAKGYGYADKKENRKATTTTLFEPGSISKSLNAI